MPVPGGTAEQHIVHFTPTDRPRGPQWGIVEVNAGKRGRWLLFVGPGGGDRRRLSAVPPGWKSLSAPQLTALWEQAAIVPKITFQPRSVSRLPIESRTTPSSGGDTSDQSFLWERERRIAAESLLQHATETIQELERELKYANHDVQALNAEIQTLVLGTTSENLKTVENDAPRAASLDP